ncbi:unknown [Clostridium sp. CAG:492]|nr:unknown [Clostridium sp. CAG:492]
MNNEKKYSLDYNDIDKKYEVEILGLVFNLNIGEIEKARENKDNLSIDGQIERIIGEKSIEKINNKMKADGHNELTANGKTVILGFLIETYMKVLSNNMTNRVTSAIGNIQQDIDNNINRAGRRGFNNQYNNRNIYKYNNRNNYRRY